MEYLRPNPIHMVDLSVNSWPRKEREATGSVVVPTWDDDAVAELAAFGELRQINLRGADLSDIGLLQVAGLFQKLEKIDLSGTKVTEAGLDRFRKARPRCEIIVDADWEGKMSPMQYTYWQRLELGIIDEAGNFIGEP